MEFIQWNNEKMSIGIKLIDDQHKELLKITNQLSTSIHNQSQKNEIVIIIDELIDYAGYHFESEEKLFEKLDFEETEKQKKEHSKFLNKFISIKNEIIKDKVYLIKNAIDTAEDIFKYIVKWLLNHIVGSDRKYIDLFKENQIQ